jgi:hypothetical protein
MKLDRVRDVNEIRDWFARYVRPFKSGSEADRRNIILKEEHTFRVCDEILYIGEQLGLTDGMLRLAAIAALLHDVGRFEQYARYRTFVDGRSEDHAKLGVELLKRHNVLKGLAASDAKLILRAIECHNRASLPRGEAERTLFFIKLLRDADKLDIWKVVTDYYRLANGVRNSAIELDLPDAPEISDEVCSDLMEGRIADIAHVRTLNDFKLLQVAWVFDVNFNPTFRRIKERRYLEMIRAVLPRTGEIEAIFDVAQRHLRAHAGERGDSPA